jgi:hypothetical protein
LRIRPAKSVVECAIDMLRATERRVSVDFPARLIESLGRQATAPRGETPAGHQGLDR